MLTRPVERLDHLGQHLTPWAFLGEPDGHGTRPRRHETDAGAGAGGGHAEAGAGDGPASTAGVVARGSTGAGIGGGARIAVAQGSAQTRNGVGARIAVAQGSARTHNAASAHVTQGSAQTRNEASTHIPVTQGSTQTHNKASTHIPVARGCAKVGPDRGPSARAGSGREPSEQRGQGAALLLRVPGRSRVSLRLGRELRRAGLARLGRRERQFGQCLRPELRGAQRPGGLRGPVVPAVLAQGVRQGAHGEVP